MARETKLGLLMVVVLIAAFSGLLYKRLNTPADVLAQLDESATAEDSSIPVEQASSALVADEPANEPEFAPAARPARQGRDTFLEELAGRRVAETHVATRATAPLPPEEVEAFDVSTDRREPEMSVSDVEVEEDFESSVRSVEDAAAPYNPFAMETKSREVALAEEPETASEVDPFAEETPPLPKLEPLPAATRSPEPAAELDPFAAESPFGPEPVPAKTVSLPPAKLERPQTMAEPDPFAAEPDPVVTEPVQVVQDSPASAPITSLPAIEPDPFAELLGEPIRARTAPHEKTPVETPPIEASPRELAADSISPSAVAPKPLASGATVELGLPEPYEGPAARPGVLASSNSSLPVVPNAIRRAAGERSAELLSRLGDFVPVEELVIASPSTSNDGDSLALGTTALVRTPERAESIEGQTYTVQANDNFWTIARRKYGEGKYHLALARHNQATIPDPKKMRVGVNIQLPATEELRRRYPELIEGVAAREPAGSRVETAGLFQDELGQTWYRVGAEDTLSGIAQKVLGKASRWKELYEANRNILADGNQLKIGTSLRVPTTEGATTVVPDPFSIR